MNKLLKTLITIIMCLFLCTSQTVLAEESLGTSMASVSATFMGETVEVSREVMEIDGGTDEPIHIKVKMYGDTSGLKYSLCQYDGKDIKYAVNASSPEFDVYATDLKKNAPIYMVIRDSKNNLIVSRLINLRINQGEAEKKVPADIGFDFGKGIFIDMSDILPGMEFNFLPFLIPVTAKAYSDGRFVAGIGLNSTDVKFWNDARNGTLVENIQNQKMEDAFYGNSENRKAVSGSNMGLIVICSGFVQGNIFTNEPIRGHMQMFIGTGFDIVGQYAILTWEVTVIGGADGSFDFSFVYDEANSKYQFQPDEVQIGVKGMLELYGGLGLANVFSVGIYGAGSVAVHTEMYPEVDVDHIILAGECGFKVKLFSKALFTFKFISGSHDFVHKNGNALMNFAMDSSEVRSYLLQNNYGNTVSAPIEAKGEMKWYGGQIDEDENRNANKLTGYETDPDFAHLLASDIYPDSNIQIVNSGSSASPQMTMVFLGSDNSRISGNRSRLMSAYYRSSTSYVSDPSYVDFGYEDDMTADYDPYIFKDEINNRTYLIWKNATKQISSDMSFSEIAANTEICFAEQTTTNYAFYGKVTDYSGSGQFATGAKVASDQNGDPVVVYYLNDVDDPAGLDESKTHEVYLAFQERISDQDKEEESVEESQIVTEEIQEDLTEGLDEAVGEEAFEETDEIVTQEFIDDKADDLSYQEIYRWRSEKVTEVEGSITDVDTQYFMHGQSLALSYTKGGSKKLELWRDGEKIWERNNAVNGKFVYYGYNYKLLTWFENGRLWVMDESSNVWAMTPEDMILPSSNYQLYGKFGSQSVMIVGTSSNNSKADAYAMLSDNGGTSWYRTKLTNIDENALVDHIGVAFTYDGDPMIVYSVQNYQINYDPKDTDAQYFLENGVEGVTNLQSGQLSALMMGDSDDRFTDTTADLYIKARRSNVHATILSGAVIDELSAQYRTVVPSTLRICNDGLYDLDKIKVYQEGIFLEEIEVDLKRGETKDIEIHPMLVGASDLSSDHFDLNLGISIRDNGAIEDRYTLRVGEGTVTTDVEHVFVEGQEKIEFHLENHGFSTKKYKIVVRDEKNDKTIFEDAFSFTGQSDHIATFAAKNGLFTKDGYKDLTIYILKDGESIDSDDVISSRKFHFEPLDEIYGTDISELVKKTQVPDTPVHHNDNVVVPQEPYESPQGYQLPNMQVAQEVSSNYHKEEKEEKEPVEIKDEETPMAESPEQQKEEIRKPYSDPGYRFLYLLIGMIMMLLMLMVYFLWRLREDEEY